MLAARMNPRWPAANGVKKGSTHPADLFADHSRLVYAAGPVSAHCRYAGARDRSTVSVDACVRAMSGMNHHRIDGNLTDWMILPKGFASCGVQILAVAVVVLSIIVVANGFPARAGGWRYADLQIEALTPLENIPGHVPSIVQARISSY